MFYQYMCSLCTCCRQHWSKSKRLHWCSWVQVLLTAAISVAIGWTMLFTFFLSEWKRIGQQVICLLLLLGSLERQWCFGKREPWGHHKGCSSNRDLSSNKNSQLQLFHSMISYKCSFINRCLQMYSICSATFPRQFFLLSRQDTVLNTKIFLWWMTDSAAAFSERKPPLARKWSKPTNRSFIPSIRTYSKQGRQRAVQQEAFERSNTDPG